jgi:hypothetical protein
MARGNHKIPAYGWDRICALAEPERTAAWAALVAWVQSLHERFADLWPERPVGGSGMRTDRRLGFPKCWPEHLGLIDDLDWLRVWDHGLRTGAAWAGGGDSRAQWRVHVDETLAVRLQRIAQQCAQGHIDVAFPIPEVVRKGPEPPDLRPGQGWGFTDVTL